MVLQKTLDVAAGRLQLAQRSYFFPNGAAIAAALSVPSPLVITSWMIIARL